jgi:hypothetical protein
LERETLAGPEIEEIIGNKKKGRQPRKSPRKEKVGSAGTKT